MSLKELVQKNPNGIYKVVEPKQFQETMNMLVNLTNEHDEMLIKLQPYSLEESENNYDRPKGMTPFHYEVLISNELKKRYEVEDLDDVPLE